MNGVNRRLRNQEFICGSPLEMSHSGTSASIAERKETMITQPTQPLRRTVTTGVLTRTTADIIVDVVNHG